MATEKETVILDFQVEQGSAINQLEKTKRSIITLKKEQQDLNKAYKEGNITLDEYASESVRLEGILKKQQSEYNNVQKSITGVKTQLDKLIDSNKKISEEFKNTASQIKVAGVSVGDISTKLASFANPATAAVGIVTALGAAYARSSIGAKDLSFAQNQLTASVNILTDQFASLFSSAEKGRGIFSQFIDGIIFKISPALAVLTNIAAQAGENLNEIYEERELIFAKNNELLGENTELLTQLSDKTLDVSSRQQAYNQIVLNSKKATEDLIKSLEEEKNQIILKNVGIKDEGVTKRELNAIDRRIAEVNLRNKREEEKASKLLSAALREEAKERQAINIEVEKYLSKFLTSIQIFKGEIAKETRPDAIADLVFPGLIEADKRLSRGIKLVKISEEQKREEYQKSFDLKRMLDDADLDAQILYLQTAATLAATFAGEQSVLFKITASAEAAMNTYVGAARALRDYPQPLAAAIAALTIAQGLANVARINNIGFAEGGYTGSGGKHQPAGIVHKGEVVWSQADVALAGGASRVDRMRPTFPRRSYSSGYADGGIVTSGATSEINQTIATINAFKNMPPSEVSVKEITKVQRRITVKETRSRL